MRSRAFQVFVGVAVFVVAAAMATVMPSHVPPVSAAAAGHCPEITDSIDRLYSAYFLREPDADGRGYWVDRYARGERNLRQISEAFAVSPEFLERYGALADREFVELLYRNVFDRTADRGGSDYWTGRLTSGLSRGALMIGFSESAEYIEQTGTTQPLAGVGRIYPVGTTFACGHGEGVATLYTGDRPMNVDILGINNSHQRAQNLLVFVGVEGRAARDVVANEILNPHEYLLLWNGRFDTARLPAGERQVTVSSADDDLHWVVVAYPEGTTLDRPGWDDRAPLQLR